MPLLHDMLQSLWFDAADDIGENFDALCDADDHNPDSVTMIMIIIMTMMMQMMALYLPW